MRLTHAPNGCPSAKPWMNVIQKHDWHRAGSSLDWKYRQRHLPQEHTMQYNAAQAAVIGSSFGTAPMWPVTELSARHRAAIERHLLALDSNDRRLRFGNPLSDAAITSYAQRMDFWRDT